MAEKADRQARPPRGQRVALPVIVGTEDEHAVDIRKLRSETGLHHARHRVHEHRARRRARSRTSTASRASCATAATRSRSSPSTRDFVEVCYLLIYGELPTRPSARRSAPSSRGTA